MYRGRYIVFLFLLAIICTDNVTAQDNVHWGTGAENDPYNVDADGDGVHTWGSNEYGQADKTIYYKLYDDCTIEPNVDGTIHSFNVVAGTVVFDLNGHKMKLYNTAGNEGKPMFYIKNGAKLIIKSTGANAANGCIEGIDGKSNTNYSRRAAMDIYGTLEFQSGVVKDFVRKTAYNSTAELGCAIYIGETGIVQMTGGTIKNCGFDRTEHYKTDGSYLDNDILHKGGAVYVASGGLFEMSGGEIANCEAFNGGAVFLEAPASGNVDVPEGKGFKMSGGTIRGCIASRRGGGVYVDASANARSRFEMSGGSILECQSGHSGAGVCVLGWATMSGGMISENKLLASYYTDAAGLPDYSKEEITKELHSHGNGVFLYGKDLNGTNLGKKSTFIMTGGTISNNISTSGGGIMAYYNSRLELNGEGIVLSGNHAMGDEGCGNGGAIYVQSSEFVFTSGTLRGNFARRYGGGININAETNEVATLTLNGRCIITDNVAGHGGGLSQENGICTLTISSDNVDISRNKAIGVAQNWTDFDSDGNFDIGGNGGGIFIEQGILKITAGRVTENKAGGDGGGIALRAERLNGGINFIMTGGVITNNKSDYDEDSHALAYNFAPGYGGGISIYNNPSDKSIAESSNKVTDISVLLGSGEISGNTANGGGGIHIYSHVKSGVTNNVNMYLGAVKNESNTIEPVEGSGISIDGNMVTNNGNGGGVTLENGNITMYKGNIENNTAYNGGGICLKYGAITVNGNESYIRSNRADNMGGGLFVVNSSGGDQKSVVFTGGTFTNNKAKNGGGICVSGNISLTATGTALLRNQAVNGGGIYLSGGGNMTYSGGLITNNTAVGVPTGQNTAYNNDAANRGVGGGVYLAEGTSLAFGIQDGDPIGLYGNTAGFAADDIYANGNGTSLVLPNVSTMKLDGFNIPTTELYWVEDYVTSDAQYSRGTKVGGDNPTEILRYRNALKNLKDIRKIDFNGETSLTYNSGEYICLALGYQLYYVTLIKKGMSVGESAVFDVAYNKGTAVAPEWVSYRKVHFPCINDTQAGDGGVKAVVVLPAGTWKFTEDPNWSWKYDLLSVKSVDSSNGESDVADKGVDGIEIGVGKPLMYIFTNGPKDNGSQLPPADEGVVVNILSK